MDFEEWLRQLIERIENRAIAQEAEELGDLTRALQVLLTELHAAGYPSNWRERYAAFIAVQELPYELDPASVREVEAAIEGWASQAAPKDTRQAPLIADTLSGVAPTEGVDRRETRGTIASAIDQVSTGPPSNEGTGAIVAEAGSTEHQNTGGDDSTIAGSDGIRPAQPIAPSAATSSSALGRPYIRNGVRAEVEAKAPRAPDGRAIDPNTFEPIDGRPDLGHKPGNEFWRAKQQAEAERLTQRQFNDRMNNPDLYQLEDPASNRSHRFEKPR